MFHVYIIKSLVKNWYYVGLTSDINKRLLSHNKGENRSTKAHNPFKLVFAQIVKTRVEARDLEKFLKVKFNKEAFLEIIDDK